MSSLLILSTMQNKLGTYHSWHRDLILEKTSILKRKITKNSQFRIQVRTTNPLVIDCEERMYSFTFCALKILFYYIAFFFCLRIWMKTTAQKECWEYFSHCITFLVRYLKA